MKDSILQLFIGGARADALLRCRGFLCSADGSTHTESNKLYRKVKHRRVSHAKRKFEPTERLASTHIHTSFQH